MSRTPASNGSSPAPSTSSAAGLKPKAPVEVKADTGHPGPPGRASSSPAGTAAAAGTSAPTTPSQAAATTPVSKEKLQALSIAVGQIEKTFGKGSIMKLDEKAYLAIPGFSTGTISLDLALGGKGIPRGRIIEIFGPESSGKTTLALTVAANAQREGGVAAFIDAEHALDPSWARRLGVNIDNLLVSQPDSGEQALEICELLVRSNAVDLIIVDSVAALIPKAEIEGEMGEAVVGLHARLMSQAMRKLTGVIARTNCTVIFINQIREKIGVMYGSPETTTGGRALKFYASVRIDIRRIGAIKEGEETVGNRTRAKVVKNKVAPPFREAEFDIMFNEGISGSGDLIDLAVEAGVVDKSGAWYTYGDTKLGQGRENAKRIIKERLAAFVTLLGLGGMVVTLFIGEMALSHFRSIAGKQLPSLSHVFGAMDLAFTTLANAFLFCLL
ncbi:MAG: recombinase RecA, partial [bacterium]